MTVNRLPILGVGDKIDPKHLPSHNHDDRYYTETEVDNLFAAQPSPESMTLIQELTVVNTTPSFTLTSIPQTYTHLFLHLIGGKTSDASFDRSLKIKINNLTSSTYNYAYRERANTPIHNGNTDGIIIAKCLAYQAGNQGNAIIEFPLYSKSDNPKSLRYNVFQSNNTNLVDGHGSQSGDYVAPITSLGIYTDVGNIVGSASCKFRLYGVK